MTLHQLECFLEVADSLSFARTADFLHLSQPAVSRQINTLEKDLGVKLFSRTTRNVSLTTYGEAFLPHAKDIYKRMLAAYSNVKHNPNDYVPVLNVGCSISSGLDYFTHILVECKEKIPELHPYLQVMSHKRLFSQITQNYIDVAFGFQESLPRASNITYHHLFFVNVCCIVSTENPLSERTSVKMDDLYSTKVIVCSVEELPVSIRNMHRHLEYLYAPPNLYYCNDLSSTLTYVRADVGYSILPDLRSYRYRDIKCIPIEGFEPLSYGYYCKSDRESETYIRQFTRILPQPSV